ncbi:MAG: DUF1232 domain-containing protein [Nitrospirae bacterium]|nr:DUF1232 domain-containing protein [Nitrospirota bacterium]
MKSISTTIKLLQDRLLSKELAGGADRPQERPQSEDSLTITKSKSLKLPILLFFLAIAYDISPVDIIPDVIPVIGWIDDFFITTTATLNVLGSLISAQYAALAGLVRILKWLTIIVGIIALCLILISMIGIVNIIAR